MTDHISATLRRLMNANFLFEDEKSLLPEDTSLRDSGIIDSMGAIERACAIREASIPWAS
jgi:hypothetical protein